MARKLRGNQTEASFAKAQTPKPPGMTPSQWEATTGNKLLSYGVDPSGNLQTGNMSYMKKDLWDAQEKERQNQIADRQFKAPERSTQIGQSFERMGLGKIGGLGGRMGQLEQASMRLAQAASDRRMSEAGQEAKLKGGLLGQEYGLRQGLAQSQANIESAQAAQMAGYSSPLQMQMDIASQRRKNERRQKEQDRLIQEARPYTIDRRGRRVYS